MAELKGRIIQKHDTEANWIKATNFLPKKGEIIIYDADDTNPVRIKVGDGVKKVNELPFVVEPLIIDAAIDNTSSNPVQNKAVAATIDQVIASMKDGTVKSVSTGEGLTGGPITTTGTIKHAVPSGASAGTVGDDEAARTLTFGDDFDAVQLTTDKFGHVTSKSTKTLKLPTETPLSKKTATSASESPTHGGVFEVVSDIAVSGHAITPEVTTITLPAETSITVTQDSAAADGGTLAHGGTFTTVSNIQKGTGSHEIVEELTSYKLPSETAVSVTQDSQAADGGTLSHGGSFTVVSNVKKGTGSHEVVEELTTYKLPAAPTIPSGTGDVGDGTGSCYLSKVSLNGHTLTGTKNEAVTAISESSTDEQIPTAKAVYNITNKLLGANDAMVFKGVLAATSSGIYTPAADAGHTYKVSAAGKINGINVQVGDMLICTTDTTAQATSSNYSTINANWNVIQANIDGALTKSGTYTNNHVLVADGTGGAVKDSGFTIGKSVPADAKFTDTAHGHAAGAGITLTGSTSGGLSGTTIIAHAATSSQGSVNNSGRTYIQDITLDEFGHITGIASATETVTNTHNKDFAKIVVDSTTIEADTERDSLTLVAGSNITLTPDATNDKITISATDTKYTHPTHTAAAEGLYKVTVDSKGHVTKTTTVTKSDITGLGIPSQDTDTHYTSKNIVGASASATADAAATNGNVYLNHLEQSRVKSNHNIKGTGATTVTSDSSGNITIYSPTSLPANGGHADTADSVDHADNAYYADLALRIDDGDID